MAKQILSTQFKKEKDKLVPANPLAKEQYKIFVNSLSEGDTVECVMELKSKNNTKAQLAKIHVCIKEIANEQGDSVESVKNEVKRICGMAYKNDDGEVKYQSFADCSKEELSNVIETIIQIGHFLNVEFRGTLDQ